MPPCCPKAFRAVTSALGRVVMVDKPIGDYTYSPSFLSIPNAPNLRRTVRAAPESERTTFLLIWTGDRKELFVQQLRYVDFAAHAQALG